MSHQGTVVLVDWSQIWIARFDQIQLMGKPIIEQSQRISQTHT